MPASLSRAAHIAIDLSRSVRTNIFHQLRQLTPEQLGQIWHTSSSGRTALYLESLLPTIKSAVHASWVHRELHRFDAVFGFDQLDPESSQTHRIPVLFLESENVADSAHHEIERLCWADAPVKVLVTVAEWSPEQYPHSTSRRRLRDRWDGYIRAFARAEKERESFRTGILCILVGECGTDGVLRFHSYEFREQSGEFFPGADCEEIALIGEAPRTAR